MASQPFLTIDNQPISLRQAMSYLRSTGDLPRVISAIVRQHTIEEELRSRNLQVDPRQLERTIINFRLQNGLADEAPFDQWLLSQQLSYDEFRSQMAAGLQFAQFKNELTAAKVEEYFAQNKALFDRVVLSRIVVAEQDLAEELMRQIMDDGRPFEQVAKDHSLADDRIFNGMMGNLTVAQLPEPIREAINGATPGSLIGPLALEGRYSVLRVEQWQPASLDSGLRQQLRERIFEQWVQEQLKNKQIQMNLD